MKEYFIYILTNENKTVLYTGITSNLGKRLLEHRSKSKSEKSFTGRYSVCRLLYYERFGNISDALAREKEIKGWRREKKERLIKTTNPYWRFLDEEAFKDPE